ncbi:MAG: chitobiase/beta-hexosaminidase C-terminal domain-containing protein [Oscillospiraceae bacterium]|nr:chitobiase/beta-hexosaminidase C-terminal domain-containing protein [Oscillospiraceae bacterium]
MQEAEAEDIILEEPAEDTENAEDAEAVEDAEATENAETAEEAEAAEVPETAEEAEAAEDTEPAEDAEAVEEPAPADEPEELTVLVVEAEETCFAAQGELVYNNGGTVYNNSALVYNNGGTVYNNGGTVYNNKGVVYANDGIVYNNAGTVYNNGALVYAFEGDVETSLIYGCYRITLAEDYSAFADFEGLDMDPQDDSLIISKDTVCTITPKAGLRIVDAKADVGKLTADENGGYLLSDVDANVTLTLRFQAEAPELDLAAGTYAEAQTLTITAPKGAEIYYTLDGSEPGEENSFVYGEPFALSESATVCAVAIRKGAEASEPVTAAYAIPEITAPEFEAVDEGYKQPAAQPLTVANPGSATAHVESVELTDEQGAFTLNRTTGTRIAAGTTDTGHWSIRPAAKLAAGTYEATLTVTLDSGDTVELPLTFQVNEVPAEDAAEAEAEA